MTSGHIHMNRDFHVHDPHVLGNPCLHIWNICLSQLEKRNQFHMIHISYLTWKTYPVAIFIGYDRRKIQL